MKKFAFISRHALTDEQLSLAAEQEIELIPIGDLDAFSPSREGMARLYEGGFDGVVVVHPWLALILSADFAVGVFENANRAPEGEKPSFFARKLYVTERHVRAREQLSRMSALLTGWQRGEIY